MRSVFPICLLLGVAIWPTEARAQTPLSNCKSLLVEKQRFEYPVIPGTDNIHEGILSGRVKILCDDMVLQAEEIRWREDADLVYASGDVYFEQLDTRINADKAEMNRSTKLGSFTQAYGRLEMANERPNRSLFGIQEPYILFWAERIEKVAADKYVLHHGGFTSCRQPTPRWDMTASRVTLVPGEHAVLTNMVLRVKDVPLFYLPGLYYPINKSDRATGFLLPTYGQSTIRGMSLSNAFFWAINRSQDATFYHDLFTKTGQAYGTEYRHAGEGSSGMGRIYIIDERDQFGDDGVTVVVPGHKSYDFRGNLSQGLGSSIRLTGHVNYFTDIQTQQIYQQSIYDFSLRTRSYGAALTAGSGRYRFSAQYENNDLFYVRRASRFGTAPVVSFAVAEKAIGSSPVYFGANTSGGYVLRMDDVEDPASERSLWRIDGGPRISVPVSRVPSLTVTASAAWRYTYWTQSLDDKLVQVRKPITRSVLDLQTRIIGPVFSRIWRTPQNRYAEGFKHLIEPFLNVGWVSNHKEADNIVRLDGSDFLTTGTTTVAYGITNRLLAKRRGGGAPGQSGIVREILSVDLRQSYYTNSAASQYDAEYQSRYPDIYSSYRPPTPFSPIRLTAAARPSDTSTAQFTMEYDGKYGVIRNYSVSAGVDQPAAEITFGWSKQAIIPEIPSYTRPYAYHFVNLHATIKDPDNGLGGTFAFNYDVLHGFFMQRRYRMFYNTQCCGVAFDFQSVDFSEIRGFVGPRTDRRVSLSFTLAGIGTFSNPLGAFGGSTGPR